jgi:fatty acid desaturase
MSEPDEVEKVVAAAMKKDRRRRRGNVQAIGCLGVVMAFVGVLFAVALKAPLLGPLFGLMFLVGLVVMIVGFFL